MLDLKIIILPRQARDKHRESTQKRDAFVAGVSPDITIFGKAVGGGMPVGAIGGSAALMDVLDSSNPETFLLGQSGTFSGAENAYL